jgi:hypothetical protein
MFSQRKNPYCDLLQIEIKIKHYYEKNKYISEIF